MKAQKLLFYTHGWHLATTGQPAIDQPFEVWQWGPVVPVVYHELKRFGGSPITAYVKDPVADKPYVVNDSCKPFYDALDIAWEKYIGISGMRLSAMTHEPGSPWDIAKRQGETVISDDLIRQYFVRLATGGATAGWPAA
ncbi:Panacea domain-containing protein [Bradyrhizobium sp. SZCCHNRI3043]|uniref:Panacea domain-containing protein n=1 Tax=Bradyrhizobium sp. SZCCHNRI3043 TaxID=3057292 RepID=UPI0028EB0E94|nr:type II toxin-antitoxin system antitoxin SocA domain-containing protein [Bradyrhizobium sp. SZCCHNRI3043]